MVIWFIIKITIINHLLIGFICFFANKKIQKTLNQEWEKVIQLFVTHTNVSVYFGAYTLGSEWAADKGKVNTEKRNRGKHV